MKRSDGERRPRLALGKFSRSASIQAEIIQSFGRKKFSLFPERNRPERLKKIEARMTMIGALKSNARAGMPGGKIAAPRRKRNGITG